MDRSVDSIGSCSLDVDADSTDFSDTSGELNFLTPISGKDITREFTAGIKERCMLPVINCQAVTSVLDPVTGHISTVLTTTATSPHPTCPSTVPLLGGGDTSPPALAANKKPSYLNLACCVNGYSNLTTYDSKLRQDINKSREVSPSRPIIATLHYNRTDSGTGGGHLLTAPTLSYVSMNNTINNNYNGTGQLGSLGSNRMFKMNGTAGSTVTANGAGGRIRATNGSLSPSMGADVTDNMAANGLFNGNGSFIGGGMTMRSKVISSQSQISSLSRDDPGSQLLTPKKSFIQQRVEKLYGATEGVVINKQYYSSSERKYLNNIANENHGNGGALQGTGVHGKGTHPMANGNGATGSLAKNGGLHPPYLSGDWGSLITVDENNRQINGDDHEDVDTDIDSLPVLRHLRPEFRAQLQIFSPKKVPKTSPQNRVGLNSNSSHGNGIIDDSTAHSLQTNGNSHVDNLEREELANALTNGSTNRSTVATKSARTTSSHITTTTNSNGTTRSSSSNNGHREKETIEESSITRHHSNASTRTVTVQSSSNVIEQQQTQASLHDCRSSSTSATEMVEQKMRSLVVVPPHPPSAADGDCVSSQRTATAGSSAAIVAALDTDTDVPAKPATLASMIENGEQNGAVDSCSSNGVDKILQSRVAATTEGTCEGIKIVGEIVHCDSSVAAQEAASVNSMRTSNGADTTIIVGSAGSAASSLPPTMADIDRHHLDATEVEGIRHAKSTVDTLAPAPASTIIETTSNGNNNNNVLDGNYFLQILKTERQRLEAMADAVEKEINHLQGDGVDIGEDMNGYILVAVGKARLLCSQKMKQFQDLCYTNLNQSPNEKFQTTGEDLRGFWDMVMLQVNNVDATFVKIDSFRTNGWRKPISTSPPPGQARNGGAPRTTKLVKRPYKTPTSATNGAGSTVTDGRPSNGVAEAKKVAAAVAAAKREAQRKQLMEMKRKQKLANSQQQEAVEIFAPSTEEAVTQLNGDATHRATVDTS